MDDIISTLNLALIILLGNDTKSMAETASTPITLNHTSTFRYPTCMNIGRTLNSFNYLLEADLILKLVNESILSIHLGDNDGLSTILGLELVSNTDFVGIWYLVLFLQVISAF